MKFNFMAKTHLGKWSVGLIIAFFLLFTLSSYLFLASGDTFGVISSHFSDPLAVTLLLVGISGVCAFFTGIMSIIKKKERAITVYIATLIGLFILVNVVAFLFAE